MEKSDITLKADDVPTMLSLPSPTSTFRMTTTEATIAQTRSVKERQG